MSTKAMKIKELFEKSQVDENYRIILDTNILLKNKCWIF